MILNSTPPCRACRLTLLSEATWARVHAALPGRVRRHMRSRMSLHAAGVPTCPVAYVAPDDCVGRHAPLPMSLGADRGERPRRRSMSHCARASGDTFALRMSPFTSSWSDRLRFRRRASRRSGATCDGPTSRLARIRSDMLALHVTSRAYEARHRSACSVADPSSEATFALSLGMPCERTGDIRRPHGRRQALGLTQEELGAPRGSSQATLAATAEAGGDERCNLARSLSCC